MHSFVVEAWINDVAIANVQPDTPSPSKRARTTENDDEIASFELDTDVARWPIADQRCCPKLEVGIVIPNRARQQTSLSRDPSETSRSQSRSASPTKRFLKTESLLSLAVPIEFIKPRPLAAAVPNDAYKLMEALSAIVAGETLLPAVLRSHPDFQNDPQIRRHAWRDETQPASAAAAAAEHTAALQNHEHLCRLVDESLASANRHRSEAGWNNLVHTPLLQHATQNISHLEVEPIMSAQILPACRPLLASGKRVPLPSSEASTAGSSASGRSFAPIATSVHKMVDYALVLRPSDTLQTLINEFLASEPWERQSINQTRYEPLRAQPAPIFIETKTISGTKDSANMQLSIWVAAWRERMRTVALRAGSNDKILTLPVIQVTGGDVWSVLYVVDDGNRIRVLDGNCRIGTTDSILGIYQLQASIAALGCWVEETFTPWLTDLLSRAVENEA
ncbi:hypothetical protein CCM_09262 [Cordyceps militaris CM01]|uniref:PD-(D/E)XK nuclease-like domain-containing protein n=1 Tax=Cordyceps militaris (strain CM01) TaxID=983644 RepID=G3JTX2_CORMM|nr:uncharacterized protein CCM_09262 [Cordyceps militaris CM01]EGX88126.1 hypothetical protein CCM_09262 [Cordyceps militaris CM01]